MNNRTKLILTTILILFTGKHILAQSAYNDLLNALYYSQRAANASTNESAAYWASHAFDDGNGNHNYSGYNAGHNYGFSGATITYANHNRRRATNISNVGLKTGSSGYNQGAELARFYAEQRAAVRAERIRRETEKREKQIASYMDRQYAKSQKRGDIAKAFIYNNSTAKPLSPETISEIISNGLSGNLIIDDEGQQYYIPEMLLEGAGKTHEILEDKLKHMSDEDIENLAEELNKKNDNGEELSDEELDFLIAKALEHKANLEEEITQLEEAIAKKDGEETPTNKSHFISQNSNNTQTSLFNNNNKTTDVINETIPTSPISTNSLEQPAPEARQNTVLFEDVHASPGKAKVSSLLPNDCIYTVLLQPSRLKENIQLVYNDNQRFPLLRKNGKIVFLSDNTTEDITAYNLPSEIRDNDNAFVINNQLICKCRNHVKSTKRKKTNDVFYLPDENFDIYPARGESFYLVRHKEDSSFVYLFDTQIKNITKQFVIPYKIENLSGSLTDCFVSSGNMIYHASKETQKSSEIGDAEIHSIAFYSGGAFFSTEKACYYIGSSGSTIPIINGNIRQLMMIDNRLYLLYEDGKLSVINNANRIPTLLGQILNE